MSKYYVGIDIGSTASKTVVIDENQVVDAFTLPTGWSGQETAENIYEKLKSTKGRRFIISCFENGYRYTIKRCLLAFFGRLFKKKR